MFAWDANPAVDQRLCKLSNARAQEIVDEGRGRLITLPSGHRAVQYLPSPAAIQETPAWQNLIPFGRVFSKFMAPPSINYPIPCCGARTRILRVAVVNSLGPLTA